MDHIFIRPSEDRANRATSDTSVGQWGRCFWVRTLVTLFKWKHRGSKAWCKVVRLVLLKR